MFQNECHRRLNTSGFYWPSVRLFLIKKQSLGAQLREWSGAGEIEKSFVKSYRNKTDMLNCH